MRGVDPAAAGEEWVRTGASEVCSIVEVHVEQIRCAPLAANLDASDPGGVEDEVALADLFDGTRPRWRLDQGSLNEALVDQDQVDPADLRGVTERRLDSCEQDRRIVLATSEPRRADAGRRSRPAAQKLRVVLRNQLLHVGQDDDALARVGREHRVDEGGQHERLASAGREHHQRVPGLLLEPAEDAVDGFLLVRAQLHGERRHLQRRVVEEGVRGGHSHLQALTMAKIRAATMQPAAEPIRAATGRHHQWHVCFVIAPP